MTKIIAQRDQDIIRFGMEAAEVKEEIEQNKEIFDERVKQLEMQKRINWELEAKTVMGNREISDRKNENKKLEF